MKILCLISGIVLVLVLSLACGPKQMKRVERPFLYNDKDSLSDHEKTFFDCIYRKYPDNYYPLGSSEYLFSESLDTKGNLLWKFSFMIVDTTASGNKRYLKEVKEPLLQKYLPKLHVYAGRHSHHWELLGSVKFMAFVYNDYGNYIYNDSFDHQFIETVKSVSINDVKEKEQFCSALFNVIQYCYEQPNEWIRTVYRWNGEELYVRKEYENEELVAGSKNKTGLEMVVRHVDIYFTFQGDSVVGIMYKQQ